MNTTGKWLARGGALLIVVGFLLPTLTVSCSVMPGMAQSYTLGQIASQFNQPLLYLVLIGALAVLALAFLPIKDRNQTLLFLMGQIVGLGIGALSMLIAIASLYNQIQQLGGSNLSLNFGGFVLILGYGLAAAGVVMQFFEGGMGVGRRAVAVSPPAFSAQQAAYGPPAGARLEVVRGNRPGSTIPIQTGDFSIGRGRENHLQLRDLRASRLHARIRYAQGAWFIQDQNSSGGTSVNGKPVRAARLNPGDQITIGDTILIFRP